VNGYATSTHVPIDARMLAIDPGDVHVGVSCWANRRWQYAEELTQAQLWEVITGWRPTLIVLERFHLYPWMAKTQSFSTMPTSQLIGAIKRTAEVNGIHLVEQQTQVLNLTRKTPYYKNHIAEHGKPWSEHAESALLHGLYYLNLGKGS